MKIQVALFNMRHVAPPIIGTNRPWAVTPGWQQMTYKPSKLAQTGRPTFWFLSMCIRRLDRARLQVSVYRGYDLGQPG